MPKFTVHSRAWTDIEITVEAEDHDEAMDVAFEEGPGGLCAHCTGWNAEWDRDEGDAQVYKVTDENGETVWSDDEVTA